jgi:hypothetical protein
MLHYPFSCSILKSFIHFSCVLFCDLVDVCTVLVLLGATCKRIEIESRLKHQLFYHLVEIPCVHGQHIMVNRGTFEQADYS